MCVYIYIYIEIRIFLGYFSQKITIIPGFGHSEVTLLCRGRLGLMNKPYMEVSINGGTSKWMVYNGKSY